MTAARYVRNSIPGFVLCVLISCSISFTVCSGFYIRPSLQNNLLLLALLTGVLTALLTAAAWDRRTVKAGIAVLVAGTVLFVVIARSRSEGNIFRDTEDNPCLYFVIVVVTAVLVYLLTRRRWGCGLLFVAGSITLTGIQFLYQTDHVPALLLFLCSSGAMYIYRNYERSVLGSETARPAFGRAFAISGVCALLVVALGLGAYAGIVRVLDPPAHELKLITKYMALETWQKMGIADYNEILDPDMATRLQEEEARRAQQENDQKDQKDHGDQKEEREKDENPATLDSSNSQAFYVVNYLRKWVQPWMIPALLVLLVLAAVLLKRYQRRHWLRQVLRKDPQMQIRMLYGFFLKGLHRMKIRRRPGETLLEFVEHQGASIRAFAAEDNTFEELTGLYMDTVYGGQTPSEEEIQRYLTFYGEYYANCRRYLGKVKYILRFFSL